MRILLKTLMDNSYCGVLENRARRPCSTMVSMANLSRTVVSVPRPPATKQAAPSSNPLLLSVFALFEDACSSPTLPQVTCRWHSTRGYEHSPPSATVSEKGRGLLFCINIHFIA